MSENKQPGRAIPLRVRFRSPTERLLWERELAAASSLAENGGAKQAVSRDREIPDRTRQIKEVIRLGNVLRAELGLQEVLQQIVASISACTGFRIAVINLVDPGSKHCSAVAFAGSSEESRRLLQEHPTSLEDFHRVMRPEFRISQSYFIPHERSDAEVDNAIVWAVEKTEEDYEPGGWHPLDALLVPLYSSRKKELLGVLSLDDPIDGKRPSQEAIEMIELFANQAAIALDNARIFQEREAERLALEQGINRLRRDMERLQRGDLRSHISCAHEKLQSVVDAVNRMIDEFNDIMGSVQTLTQAVDEHIQGVRMSSDMLAHDVNQQERQVEHISHVIDSMAETMKSLADRAEKMSRVAGDAREVTLEGEQKVDRANEGMRKVRDSTMQSSHVMKRLGESGQEINDTIVTITDITTRMNLLALNAAIEAARAGEQGQGFVVIAQEIRSLAVTSAEAARKVATRIRTIQSEMSTLSQSVNDNISQVVLQSELMSQTGVALEAISEVIQQMFDLVQGLDAAADNQRQGAQLVSHSIEEISRMASEITQQCGHMNQSLAHLGELTNSLRKRLSIIRIADR